MRCEECGSPDATPVCSADPDDPWPLCDDHAAALKARLDEAAKGPVYSLAEVKRMVHRRRRWALYGWLWDRWECATAPLLRFACIHLNQHSRGCRGTMHCRIGNPRGHI